MTIHFQTHTFPTAKTFGSHVHHEILTLPLHRELAGADLDFATALLHCRRDWQTKAGPTGIAAMWVVANGSGREFRFRRVGEARGSHDSFSWRKILRGESDTAQYVSAAMRFAVLSDVQRFRDQAFAGVDAVRSAISGAMLTSGQAEIDHVIPFSAIRDQWLVANGGISEVRFTRETTEQTPAVMTDPQQLASWRAAHARAELRVISRSENQELGRAMRAAAQERWGGSEFAALTTV